MSEELAINPQLCRVFNPKKHEIIKPMWIEPKFDGLRGIIVIKRNIARAFSRNGKPFWNIDHILSELSRKEFNGCFLDGEFYCNNWNESMSILKSQDVHPNALNIKFYAWDLISLVGGKLVGTKVSLSTRYLSLENRYKLVTPTKCELVGHKVVTSLEEVQSEYAEFRNKGYEGAILKDPDGPYEMGRRSPYWLKIKPWADADLKVIGAFEGNGKHVGRLGKVLLEGNIEINDQVLHIKTECGTGFNDKEREDFWAMHLNGKLSGCVFEVLYQEIEPSGALRFPVYTRDRTSEKG
jgi:bifunctional non-homologous end joining protein LigD